jgi:hypothetical protein
MSEGACGCAVHEVTLHLVRTARINRYHDMPCSNDIDIISNYWYWCPPLIGIHISTDTFPISSMDACALTLHSLELSFFHVASPSLYSFTLCVHENAIESMFLYRERERGKTGFRQWHHWPCDNDCMVVSVNPCGCVQNSHGNVHGGCWGEDGSW